MDFCTFFFFYSSIQVPPHLIWVPSSHSHLSKKTSLTSNSFITPTVLSAKQSPTIRQLISPLTEIYFPGTLSTSPLTNPLSENSMPSTSVTTTHSSSESVAQPTMPTLSSITSKKSITVPIPATKSVTNAAFLIKSGAAHLNKTSTILSPSVGFTKHSSLSSSEPHKVPIVNRHFEAITESAAQIPPAASPPVAGLKNVSTVPIVPLTPFTISLTPTVSPVNRSVSASRPHSTADGHGTPGKYDK